LCKKKKNQKKIFYLPKYLFGSALRFNRDFGAVGSGANRGGLGGLSPPK